MNTFFQIELITGEHPFINQNNLYVLTELLNSENSTEEFPKWDRSRFTSPKGNLLTSFIDQWYSISNSFLYFQIILSCYNFFFKILSLIKDYTKRPGPEELIQQHPLVNESFLKKYDSINLAMMRLVFEELEKLENAAAAL
jgi:hypothetical protein